jgi:hypothetical protein
MLTTGDVSALPGASILDMHGWCVWLLKRLLGSFRSEPFWNDVRKIQQDKLLRPVAAHISWASFAGYRGLFKSQWLFKHHKSSFRVVVADIHLNL